MKLMDLVERNWIPDPLIRAGIRHRLSRRLQTLREAAGHHPGEMVDRFAAELRELPIALHTDDANQQHYELPPRFFQLVLGPRLKYSSGYWEPGCSDLEQAEEAMLDLYAERAGIGDGQEVLDLGCGWGSLSIYLAERFPGARFTAVSNSRSQRTFIEALARDRNLRNLEVITADVQTFEPPQTYDRVLSIEMFEHMKNYELLLRRIAAFLKPSGTLFVHVFVHRCYAYHYVAEGEGDWMARYFFTGGLMPSWDLLPRFQQDLVLEKSWEVPGTHYERTANAWLENMSRNREAILPVLTQTYGKAANLWWGRWRIFFMACAELFGFEQGREWHVAHYRFGRSRTEGVET
jgi:cyclopropane-fatty-acyl-phospholipid synthase